MIEIKRFAGPSFSQWDMVIDGVRNSYSSWDKRDSTTVTLFGVSKLTIGPKDMELMKNLCSKGPEERKFLRQLPVIMDINAPLYWWKEVDTYKVGTTANSTSTMHTVLKEPFSTKQFSCERLPPVAEVSLSNTIADLNDLRERWFATDSKNLKKELWYSIIQLLPESWMQLRTVSLNYEVLRSMYRQRKDHKLAEWLSFCSWIRTNIIYSEAFIVN
jgi:hypothetical protein